MSMQKYSFEELVEYIDIKNIPEGLKDAYLRYEGENDSKLLMRSDFISDICGRYNVPADKEYKLEKALRAIESDEKLLYFSRFLISDMCSARNRCDNEDYTNFDIGCMGEFNEYYDFLILLACVEPSREQLVGRRVPVELYDDIAFTMIRKQLKQYIEKDDIKVHDFPWDMNFYTSAIFLLDRFYFIPYRFGDPFRLFRNVKTGEVVGIYNGGYSFDAEGQLIENEEQHQTESFKTELFEDDKTVTGFYMNPTGLVENRQISLDKSEWKVALKDGDGLLALHIPGGEGYNPERLKNSMEQAMNFYDTYFPEIEHKGFWSESWLYDGRLSFLLGQESNIVRVQRQFFNYSIGEDGLQLRLEMWGDRGVDIKNVRRKTTLEKKAAEAIEAGRQFHSTSMVFLREEIAKVGANPYVKPADEEQLKAVVGKAGGWF